MTTTVKVYANKIESNNNFENRILKVVPSTVNEIVIDEAGMERASGYGQYKYFIKGSVDGESFCFKQHSTNSQVWDWYQSCEANKPFIDWKKRLIICLLDSYFQSI